MYGLVLFRLYFKKKKKNSVLKILKIFSRTEEKWTPPHVAIEVFELVIYVIYSNIPNFS
jgi:hypothetical protein